MSKTKVVNVNWYPKSINLSHNENFVYIGRPSKYGNPFSMESNKYIREECVALHRVDLYKNLIEDKTLFSIIKHDLLGKDLGCWCKQNNKVISCHGDNFLHILSHPYINRSYDRNVLYYLMEDLKACMDKLFKKAMYDVDVSSWMNIYFGYHEVRLDINHILSNYKKYDIDDYTICTFIAYVVIDIELAVAEKDPKMIDYRILHAEWIAQYFFKDNPDRLHEPVSPTTVIRKPKKQKTLVKE